MAYKTNLEDQKKFDYKEFIRIIEKIEQNFTSNIQRYTQGRHVFVLLSGAFEQTYFEKTTVSDLRSVLGEIDFDCIIDNQGGFGNVIMYSLREPGKKDFRGKIKYTPKGTISVSMRFIAVNDDGTRSITGWDKVPFLQDENFVISSCDNLYLCDEEGSDYDYIEKHAFRALTNDKRFKCGDNYLINPSGEQEISQSLHRICCNMFDVSESWGVCYEYAGSCFIFPLKREYIQELFKKRDKENGRRRVIASLVGSYTKKDGTVVDGHLRTAGGFSIDGRDFGLFIGTEDFEKYFPNTPKSRKRAERYFRNMEIIPGTHFGVSK